MDRMAIRGTALGLLLAAGLVLSAGCGDEREAWGEAVDPAEAVPLSQLLSGNELDPSEAVTASGRIGEVFQAFGCWLVLQEVVGGKLHEVLVDLKPRADFTVPVSVTGRDALVRGWLVGEKPDLELEAVGLELE